MITEGDWVEARYPGGRDREGLPVQIPLKSRLYRIKSIYERAYGLGCTLESMDPWPYKGYLLFVLPEVRKLGRTGWYFRKAEASPSFQQMLKTIQSGGHVNEILVDNDARRIHYRTS